MKKLNQTLQLTPSTYNDYLQRVYASWLGKIIGIRLGAPIESWTFDEIQRKYPDIKGYLTDYDIFAADDDSNGPLFFVRALEKGNNISAKDIGDSFLNYLQEYTGFFWWGGIGVSTEHTAYENLKKGICAPQSGSKEQNGIVMAEQIGGQIFSDCWGYVSGYDPLLAKDLAVKAASVTHDKNGLQGAIFVAVAITLAMQSEDIMYVLNETLRYLDHRMKYYRVVKDIMDFHQNNPNDWLDCFRYIQKNYGYDKFAGSCHIIPNSAIMVLSMCYGENDFSRTLCILNQCGWDTDCTCGNVGSIMGALLGIDGIDPYWIKPINDVVNASSCIGSENIDTVSRSAQMFARYAMQLKGYDKPDYRHFLLPYATEGFRSSSYLSVSDGRLEIPKEEEVYFFSYYLPEDIYDARYDPVFSPKYYPHDLLHFLFESSEENRLTVFAEDCEGNRQEAVYYIQGESEIEFRLKGFVNTVIHRIGFIAQKKCYLKDYSVTHESRVSYDFSTLSYDGYGPRYAGDTLYNIRSFNNHSGKWILSENGLKGQGTPHALITTGTLSMHAKSIEMNFENNENLSAMLVFGFRGYQDFYALGINGNSLELYRKGKKYTKLYSQNISNKILILNSLKAVFSNDKITVYFNDESCSIDFPEMPEGGIGILSLSSAVTEIHGFKFSTLDLNIENSKRREK